MCLDIRDSVIQKLPHLFFPPAWFVPCINSYHFHFVGPPSKPVGPLKTSDVGRSSVTLDWQPPKDDGGSPLTGYILEKKDLSRPSWTKIDTLPPNKTSFKVENLTEGAEFKFRVTAENKVGTSEPLETDKAVQPKSLYGKLRY